MRSSSRLLIANQIAMKSKFEPHVVFTAMKDQYLSNTLPDIGPGVVQELHMC